MYSDSIHEAYMLIYQGIVDYKDYCEVQKANTINAMTSINMIIFSFSGLVNDNFVGGDCRARDIAIFDYNNAIKGIGYCQGEEWANHAKYHYLETNVKH